MAVFELEFTKSDSATVRRYPVDKEVSVIGRSTAADITLPSKTVSRQHARVLVETDTLIIEDLGARNGVLVNGEPTPRAVLRPNDCVQIGAYTCAVRRSDSKHDTSALISYDEATALYKDMTSLADSDRLPTLYKAAQLLGTVFDIDELLAQILDLIFHAVPAQRGYVLLMSKTTREPEVRAELPEEFSGEERPISRTLLDEVLKNQSALLTFDAQADTRFAGSDSVERFSIHAAMCVPLCGRLDLIGAIYVDGGPETSLFTNEDLELLSAIGRVVGIAVENADLYQENLRKERLSTIGLTMANVSHSVKNILTGIRGGESLINKAIETRDWAPIDVGWPILTRSIERIETLLLNLLTLSKDRKPQRTATSLEDLVEEVLQTAQPFATRGGITLEFERGDVPAANVDGRAIFRVMLNLVLNGIDACKKKGIVTVACTLDSDAHIIEVNDTGRGIKPGDMPTLFDLFKSSKGSTGTGLGLASSHKVVKEHGGDLKVHSVVGKGSTFIVRLPIVR
ncbi:MAG: FHA domain-containing protein [bacterium]|nr:FHA domain-containing protein [bacterium]